MRSSGGRFAALRLERLRKLLPQRRERGGVEIFAAAHRRRFSATVFSASSSGADGSLDGVSAAVQTAATKRIAKARQNAKSGGRRLPASARPSCSRPCPSPLRNAASSRSATIASNAVSSSAVRGAGRREASGSRRENEALERPNSDESGPRFSMADKSALHRRLRRPQLAGSGSCRCRGPRKLVPR